MHAPPFAGRYTANINPFRTRVFPAIFSLLAGVLLPAFTIGFELFTRMCAESLFDPVPSWAHLAAVTSVPALNLKLWLMRRREQPVSHGWIFAAGVTTAIGFCYALLFLPVYPIAVIGILFFGIGLLPFAPLSAGLASLVAAIGAGRRSGAAFQKSIWSGIAAGVLLVLALDVPTAITRYAVRTSATDDASERAAAVRLMRNFGNRDLLLRLCYDNGGYTGGLLGLVVEGAFSLRMNDFNQRRLAFGTAAARELQYRITGDPYDAVPPPWRGGRWRFANDFTWDPDQGGTQVGGRVAGLSLASSRIDGSMDADDAVAYLEWTTEFSNSAPSLEHEARMTLALPPGAVVSRATLWINDEEHEAAFAARGAARAAYERVVARRRDPLLVTTNGADQVLVQMFPVPAGGRAKIRVGITAPLALTADNRAILALPAILDRNFSIGDGFRHAVWVEGDGRDATSDAGFTPVDSSQSVVRRRASFTDRELATRRPRIALSRNPAAESVASGAVVQTIRREPREPAGSLYVLLDGSARALPGRAGLIAALEKIPVGARVGFSVAAQTRTTLPLAPWNAAQRERLIELLDAQPFNGGEDNVSALVEAIGALGGEPRATLLWIQGPQGFDFHDQAAALEQMLDRSQRLPEIWLLPVAPGPNRLLRHPRLFTSAHTLAWSGDAGADIGAAFADYFDTAPRWSIVRAATPAPGLVTGSKHVEKLWALDEIETLLDQGPDAAAERRAVQLAAQYHLVTPVSGAVVLETAAETAEVGTNPPDPAAVPTIPEPETWALLIVACVAFAWAWRSRQPRHAATAHA